MWVARTIFVLAASCGIAWPAGGAEKVVMQLRWDHQFQFAGYYAALWQGYYAEANLDVELRSAFAPGGRFRDTTKAVASGDAHFGTGAADILVARDRGAKLVVLASIFQQSPVAFYARAGTRLEAPSDLTRLRVATRGEQGFASVELRAMLRNEGIDPALVRLQPIRGQLGIHDLANDLADVATGFTISAGWIASELGLSLTSLRPSTYGVDFYGEALFARRGLIESDPALVRRFVAASLKGWEYALEHAREIAVRIARDMPRTVPVRDPIGFNRFQIKPVRRLVQHRLVRLGNINPARWRDMHEALRDVGLVTGNFNANALIYDLNRLGRERTERRIDLLLVVLGGVIVVAAAGAGWLAWRRLLDRRDSAERLRDSEERFREFAETASDWFWEMGPDFRYTYLSEPHSELTVVPLEQRIGTRREDFVPASELEENAEKWAAHRRDLEDRRPFRNFEYAWTGANGEPCHARISGNPFYGRDGRFLGYRGTGTDITRQKRDEEALRESEARFRDVAESAMDWIWELDDELTLVYVSDSYYQATGRSPDDVLGKKRSEMPPEEYGKEWYEHLEIQREHRPFSDYEFSRRRADGSVIWLSSSGKPFFADDGTFKGYRGIARDITELKQREEALRQAQKMEAVGQLTGGLAHDFNNLLTVVQGNLELLANNDRIGADAAKYVERARHAARRGGALTNRLLAFSRKQALVPRSVDLNRLVDGMTDLMRRTLGETIEIELDPARDLWTCRVDPAQLESAVLNLAINARDALAGRGRLIIASANVDLGDPDKASEAGLDPGAYVMISVTDTGKGIPPEALEHVFEPFYTTKEVGHGSGLGLSMVYGFIKQSGGQVTIASEVGVGTTVTLYLPRSMADADDLADRGMAPAPRARNESVLVVEDDPEVRVLTIELLDDLGYETLAAGDGEEALEVLDDGARVGLVLSDVVLSGPISGPRLVAEVRRRFPDLPVVLMSGYTEHASVAYEDLGDAAGLLSKPFDKQMLGEMIRLALDDEVR